MFSWKTIMHNGRDTIAAFIKDLWIYMRNKPKWKLFLEFLLSIGVVWIWFCSLLFLLFTSLTMETIQTSLFFYGWLYTLHLMLLLFSFFIFGKGKLLASFITTIAYIINPLWIWIQALFVSIFFLQMMAWIFVWAFIMVCVNLLLLYFFIQNKLQYSVFLAWTKSYPSFMEFIKWKYCFFFCHSLCVTIEFSFFATTLPYYLPFWFWL